MAFAGSLEGCERGEGCLSVNQGEVAACVAGIVSDDFVRRGGGLRCFGQSLDCWRIGRLRDDCRCCAARQCRFA